VFTPLPDQASENCGKAHPIRQVLGDGGYDRIHVFNTMENEESNQESKHGRILLQDPPDHPIALNAPGSG